ncbi:SusC/RagA family TonB-linked outer membrane protein [Mucilaginibacter yixingensis]|nr:TonB-dependent receptor [Mucilaginibacter yixingensis]
MNFTHSFGRLLAIAVFFLLSSSQLTFAQASFTVKGKVVDEKNQPLPGASVQISGQNKGVTTDVNGAFSIKLESASTLNISFVGMATQTVSVSSGKTNVTVVLKDNGKNLNEVVVVGYGTQRRADVVGSVTSVPKARLSELPTTNVLQAVEGTVAGLTISTPSGIPGTQPSASVRGRNSISASSDPYVVVDGIPLSKTGGSLNDINPNDIASVEVLKDPSAVAIYGTNGANGVILVTTKHGVTGKPVLRYSGSVGYDNIAHILRPRDGAEYAQKYKDYLAQNDPKNTNVVPNNIELTNYNAGIQTDWLKEVTQQGAYQDHNLSVSGGSENVKYYLSGDYLDQKGVVKGYQYKRITVRSNLDVNATDFLTLGSNIYYANNNYDGGRANLVFAQAMSPYGQEYNADGTYRIYPMAPEQLYTNPLLGLTTTALRRSVNLGGNGFAEVKLGGVLQGLKYRLNAGYNFVPTRNDGYTGRAANNLVGNGYANNTETNTYTLENLLTYNRNFGKHHIDFTGLYSQQESSYLSSGASSSGFVNDVITFYNLGAGTTPSVSSYASHRALRSQMGRLNYSYDSRYLLNFTVRRDGSSVFGGNTDKYGWFPVGGFGWNISNEKFMQDVHLIDNLKLRASYGRTGNEAVGVYQTIGVDNAVRYPFEGAVYTGALAGTQLGNSNLHWETKTGVNVGLDFGILHNRINGSIDYYNARTTGLLLNRALPAASGYVNVLDNIGKISNKGLDITLNTKNIDSKDFRWESTIVFSTVKNKIIDLYGNQQSDIGNGWFIGQPISVIYDYKKIGIWQTGEDVSKSDPTAKPGDIKFQDTNGDGKITADDKVIQGQTTPKWTGGFTNTFHYKNISLSVFIQTAQGQMRYNTDLNTIEAQGRANTPAAIGYWTPTNGENFFNSLSYTNTNHPYGYEQDASYTRIKDVTLSYTFPQRYLDKLHLGGLTVFASGRNLHTYTKWIGTDPEVTLYTRGSGGGGTANDSNFSNNSDNNYPLTRTIVFGVNISLK